MTRACGVGPAAGRRWIVILGTAGLAMSLFAAAAPAQDRWTRVVSDADPGGRVGHALALDPVRGRVVLFGGAQRSGNGYARLADTWEHDGVAWARRTPPTSPPARSDHQMVFDTRRGRVWLYGGEPDGISSPLGDMWEWDGTTWSQIGLANSPGPRGSGLVIAYDTARQRGVLYGGRAAMSWPGDTWEWDGTAWTEQQPAHTPVRAGPFFGHTLVFDARRGVMVMFVGGQYWSSPTNETWEWDGTDWTWRTPAHRPSPRSGFGMAYASAQGETILFGGASTTETWSWDGTDWSQKTPLQAPALRGSPGMVDDPQRQRLLLFGGEDAGHAWTDTWQWDGSDWRQALPETAPRGRIGHAADVQWARLGAPPSLVLFGGALQDGTPLGDTWRWTGSDWQVSLLPGPAPRSGHAMAWAENFPIVGVLMFGGSDGSQLFDDTWMWDDIGWTRRTPTQSPAARIRHAMAHERGMRSTFLFGGLTGQGYAGDTWQWQGLTWTLRTPAHAPAARAGHAMAYDMARRRLVLFGGTDGNTVLGDTWEWDDSDWLPCSPTHAPAARANHGMAFDEQLGRVVLFGGSSNGTDPLADTWEWNGTDWTQHATTVTPPERMGHVLAYDPARGRVLALLGRTRYSALEDVWRYEPNAWVASYAAFGAGCAGSAGIPTLSGRGVPLLGQSFSVQLGQLPVDHSALVWLGASRTACGPFPLPFDLTPIGMTGCALLVSCELYFPVFTRNGTATWTVAIPDATALLGARFFNQALVGEAAANPFGAIVSNGGEGVIGLR